jgi:hypothetical protein
MLGLALTVKKSHRENGPNVKWGKVFDFPSMQEALTILLLLYHPAFPGAEPKPARSFTRKQKKKKKKLKFLLYYHPSSTGVRSTAVSSPKLLTPPTSHFSSQ